MARFETAQAPSLVRRARQDAGLTQVQLADRADLRQATLEQIESGTRGVSPEMLERILRAADYRPSLALADRADEIIAAAHRRGFTNVRVFGSALRGEDSHTSDIDLLVTPSQTSDLFDLALFSEDVTALTGFRTDVVADGDGAAVLQTVPL